MSQRLISLANLALSAFVLLGTQQALAAPRSWQGISTNTDWSSAINWTPIGGPIATDNILVGDKAAAAGDLTNVNQDFTIDTLAISNGANVDTDGNHLDVTGNTLLTHTGSKLIVRENSSGSDPLTFRGNNLTLLAGTTLENVGGRVLLDGSLGIRAGAEVKGYGSFFPEVLVNEGEIIATSASSAIVLRADLLNLDGVNEEGALTAINGSINVQSALVDAFDGMITVGAGQVVDFLSAATIGSGGVVDLQGATNNPARFGGFGLTIGDFAGTLEVDRAGRLNNVQFQTGASVNLTNNALLEVRGAFLAIEAGASFQGSGRIKHLAGTLTLANGAQVGVPVQTGSTDPSNSKLAIGDTIGAAELLTYEPTSKGDLEIDIAGAGFTQYDRLTVSSFAALDGNLDVTLRNSFTPSAGDSFQILQSLGSPITGTFDTTEDDLPALPGDLRWKIDYRDPDLVVLRVHSADFDNDGDIDADDLTDPALGWQARYGSNLDGGNFLAWQREFSNGVRSQAASQAVPEPTIVTLTLIALLAVHSTRGSMTPFE